MAFEAVNETATYCRSLVASQLDTVSERQISVVGTTSLLFFCLQLAFMKRARTRTARFLELLLYITSLLGLSTTAVLAIVKGVLSNSRRRMRNRGRIGPASWVAAGADWANENKVLLGSGAVVVAVTLARRRL